MHFLPILDLQLLYLHQLHKFIAALTPTKAANYAPANISSPTSQPNIASQLPASSLLLSFSLNPTTASKTSFPVRNEAFESIVTQSREIFEALEPASATTSHSQIASAQRHNTKKSRQKTFKRCNERLERKDSAIQRKLNSSCPSYGRFLKNQLRTFFMDRMYYSACLACNRFSLRGKWLARKSKSTLILRKLQCVDLELTIFSYWLSSIGEASRRVLLFNKLLLLQFLISLGQFNHILVFAIVVFFPDINHIYSHSTLYLSMSNHQTNECSKWRYGILFQL